MALHNFQVGDRVINKRGDGAEIRVNETGTICAICDVDDDTSYIGVHWDQYSTRRHECGGKCPEGYGWIVRHDTLELLQPEVDSLIDEIEFDGLMDLVCSL